MISNHVRNASKFEGTRARRCAGNAVVQVALLVVPRALLEVFRGSLCVVLLLHFLLKGFSVRGTYRVLVISSLRGEVLNDPLDCLML